MIRAADVPFDRVVTLNEGWFGIAAIAVVITLVVLVILWRTSASWSRDTARMAATVDALVVLDPSIKATFPGSLSIRHGWDVVDHDLIQHLAEVKTNEARRHKDATKLETYLERLEEARK